jgi:serine phosphatase RsbU (regulator of sigma subunit)/PAS domain-containing protein
MRAWTADRRAGLAAALALTALVTLADLLLPDSTELIPLLVVVPLVAAWLTGPAETLIAGVAAVAAAVLVGAVESTFLTSAHVVGIVAVVVGAVLAVLVTRAREAERTARERTALLAHAGEVLDTRADPQAELDEIASMAVPDLADLAVVDLVDDDGTARAAAVRAADPAMADALRALRDVSPVPPGAEHPVSLVVQTGEAQLVEEMSDDDLARFAVSDRHREFMREWAYRSAIVVPLTARGRRVGALSWLRFRGREPFGSSELTLAREYARRAGLAIDHRRLFGELASSEAQIQGVLGVLAEAVTVQNADGELVYANAAAARLMGLEDEGQLIELGAAAAWTGWDVRDARGDRIDPSNLPGRRALAGDPAPEPLLMRVTHRASGEVFWRVIKSTPVLDAQEDVVLAVNVIEDVTDARRDELKQRFLAQASKLLASSLDSAVTLEKVAWAAVPELADWCAVDMPDERGRLRRVATADVEQDRRGSDRLIVGGRARSGDLPVGPPQVMRTGRAELYRTVDEELLRAAARDSDQLVALRSVGALSALVVPLVVGDRVIGTITLGTTSDSGRRLGGPDLELAEELGRRAGIAIENSRVHGERAAVAATLQEALLPPRLPVIPGLSVAARFRAAGEASQVGGDFYDLFPVGDGWMVLMGDVTGKGPSAAATTALARYTMRAAAKYESSPSRVLAQLNEALADATGPQLCTAVCLRLARTAAGRLEATVGCAGHPPPLLLVGPDATVTPVGEVGTLLGAFPDGAWVDTPVPLGAGETLVLYTDGVTDTRGETERFGFRRLEELLASSSDLGADALASRIDDALLAFQSGGQRDDVALLVLQALDGPAGASGQTTVVGEGRGL